MATRHRRAVLIVPLALSLVAVGGPTACLAQTAGPIRPREHDPFQGMERSGRIPKVPLPPDLPEPSRWRYLPEGRIKPGNVFERFLVSSFVAPQVFFEQDVGAGGGIALTDIDFRDQRRREFLGAFFTYTTEGQQKYRLLWRRGLHHRDLPGGGVIQEERSFMAARGGYSKTLTRRFFGLGPDTEEDDETSYTDEVTELGVGGDFALPRAGGDWVASLRILGEYHNLAPGRVSGQPTTDEVFPELFDQGDGHGAFALSAGLRYDTRDSQLQPYSGWRAGLFVHAPVWQTGGDAGAVFTAFSDVAITVPPLFHDGGDEEEENPPTDTVALGLLAQTSVGDLPFYDLPSLGGSRTLRGYIRNRFTGDSAWHAAAEYRFWVIPRGFAITDTIRIERVGLAVFAEAGTVADSLGDLLDAGVHTSYGIGLRVGLERTALFRADVGFSEEDVNFTLAFGLSF